MSKNEKLIRRFNSKPKDFTWGELVNVFKFYGFELKNGNGSRRIFVNKDGLKFRVHEPHPQKVIKMYVLTEAIKFLTEGNIGGDHE